VHYHGWSAEDDQWVFDTDLDRRDWLQRAAKNGNTDVTHPGTPNLLRSPSSPANGVRDPPAKKTHSLKMHDAGG